MVPLTEAWIEYRSGDRYCRDILDTVIVNRRSATRVEVASGPTVMYHATTVAGSVDRGRATPDLFHGPSRHAGR